MYVTVGGVPGGRLVVELVDRHTTLRCLSELAHQVRDHLAVKG